MFLQDTSRSALTSVRPLTPPASEAVWQATDKAQLMNMYFSVSGPVKQASGAYFVELRLSPEIERFPCCFIPFISLCVYLFIC